MDETRLFEAPRARASFADPRDLDTYLEMLGRFEGGEIDAEAWRRFRLVHGIYDQRQPGVHMQRVKVPQGILDAAQLRALAEVAESFSRGFGHITTRQNVQFHFVEQESLEPALRRLSEAGLTTREACGNSVRNVTACPWAGVAPGERFDVTPYAEALTRAFLRHPLSSSLPRKFKIAFEGCEEDHAAAAINDLGFRARVLPPPSAGGAPRRGFRVTAGGGTAALCRFGSVLCEFLPAGEILNLAEAVLRVFHRLGDREHRHASRLKFLVRAMGWDAFRAEVERELDLFRREGGAPLSFDPEHPPAEAAPGGGRPSPPGPEAIAVEVRSGRVSGPGLPPAPEPELEPGESRFRAWQTTNVQGQKQPGWSAVLATVPLGDLTSAQFRILSELALAFGDGSVRMTPGQDLLFRWVNDRDVRPLFVGLAAAGLGLAGAGTVSDVASCPGAESCRLAVTHSRGLARMLEEHIRTRPELAAAAPDLAIKVSGCPNGCAQHHVAAIGLQGSVRKVAGRAVPQYFLMLGGTLREQDPRFARLTAKIPARRVPEAFDRLVALYLAERHPGESGTEFFARLEPERARQALAGLDALAPEEVRPEDFVDPGDEAELRPEPQEAPCAP